jgi:hypothetical protein
MTKKTFILAVFTAISELLIAQAVPSQDEKFPFLETFGKNALKEWGDDDYVQTFFFVIPPSEKKPVYIRIYDADTEGKNDEVHGGNFNTRIRYTVFGGKGTHSDPDAKKSDPSGNFKSGIQLSTKTVGKDESLDDKWFTFGPFNPLEGELQPDMGGHIFKIIIEGLEGDDGNLYKMFLSSRPDENKPVEGGNAFAYEYSLRLSDSKTSINHLYPFIASNVVSVKIFVFDYDNDGILRVVSVAKKGEGIKSSGNNEWKETFQPIVKEELNTSMDVQFIKQKNENNNNIVVYITNQYGESMPFFAAPIGGVPKFKYKIKVQTGN